jgi:DNA-binding beta-propeller fold protein YncE
MTKLFRKIFYSTAILLLIFTFVFFQSCKQDFLTTPAGSVDFPDNIKAIFNTPYTASNLTCTTPSCHSSGINSAGDLDLTDWQKTMNGSVNGTMVVPYNGFWSHMVSVINSDTIYATVTDSSAIPLPGFYHKIDAQKVHIIKEWIDEGAKNKEGQVAFSDVSNNVKALVTNLASDLVAVVKTDDKLVIRLISVGTSLPGTLKVPHYITASPDNKYFYVSLIQAGYVEKYDVNTYTKIGEMAAGQSPAHIIISPDGQTGYITNFSSSNVGSGVTRFNTQNMTVTGTYTDQKITGTHGMALSRDGKYLYVAANIGEYLYKIRTDSFSEPDSVMYAPIDPSVPPNGGGTTNFLPHQIVLSPGDSLLFISCQKSNQVMVYRASDLVRVNIINVGATPYNLHFTNDNHYLFVPNRDSNSITVINYPEQTIQTTINNAGINPHGVDFTTDGQYAVIACETLSGPGGHHPQVGSNKVGVSRIIQISDFSVLPNRLEMGSWPASLVTLK